MKTFSETRIILFIIILIIISSCGKLNKKENQEFTGMFKLDNNNCFIELIITSNNDNFHYQIKTNKLDQDGQLEITKSGNEVYLRFIGLFGTEPKEEIIGQYINKKIVIQNYGNAMNKFIRLSECDMKYLELEKIKKE